jgi:hypothetical protein
VADFAIGTLRGLQRQGSAPREPLEQRPSWLQSNRSRRSSNADGVRLNRATFAQLMAEPSPTPEELALALAREFRKIDEPSVQATFDRLAFWLGRTDNLCPHEQYLRCRSLLHRCYRLRVTTDLSPAATMIDRVLEGRLGSELAIVVVYCALGRRAGIPLNPAGADGRYYVAHAESDPTIVADVTRGGWLLSVDEYPDRLRWICPHEIGYGLLSELTQTLETHGCFGEALHAAQLAHNLPLTGHYRTEIEARLRVLHAQLN